MNKLVRTTMMMDYPDFPTDNLYKFLALGGLILFLFSLIYPSGKIQEIELQLAEANAVLNKLVIEREELDKVAGRIEKKESLTVEEVQSLSERRYQLRLKQADSSATGEKIRINLEWARLYHNASLVGIILGSVLMPLGFGAWYLKLQRPQDQLIQKQIAEGGPDISVKGKVSLRNRPPS